MKGALETTTHCVTFCWLRIRNTHSRDLCFSFKIFPLPVPISSLLRCMCTLHMLTRHSVTQTPYISRPLQVHQVRYNYGSVSSFCTALFISNFSVLCQCNSILTTSRYTVFAVINFHACAGSQTVAILIALYLKPFFGLIPVVEAFQLQSRRKRKYLQLPVSTLQKCWLSTFQI